MSHEPDRSKALFTEAWGWREQLQRAMDGCHSTDDMSAYSLAHYEEFEGPNIPLPRGYQVQCYSLHRATPLHLAASCTQCHAGFVSQSRPFELWHIQNCVCHRHGLK